VCCHVLYEGDQHNQVHCQLRLSYCLHILIYLNIFLWARVYCHVLREGDQHHQVHGQLRLSYCLYILNFFVYIFVG
jgi:hypothetical protein